VAPWLPDPIGDHGAASRVAAVVAERCGIRLVEYPVWGWTLPWPACRRRSDRRLDITAWLPRKRQAIHPHRMQYGGLITDDPADSPVSGGNFQISMRRPASSAETLVRSWPEAGK
jgi:hypothetical protein